MKWHYFNEYDPSCCIYIRWKEKRFYTGCGRSIGNVKRYTEDKGQVDCLKCLKRLNYEINKEK